MIVPAEPLKTVSNLSFLAPLIAFVGFVDQSFSDSLLQEGDMLMEALIIGLLVAIWFGQPPGKRTRLVMPMVLMVASIKASYFFDHEQSFNYRTEESLLKVKQWVWSQKSLFNFLSHVFLLAVEFQIFKVAKSKNQRKYISSWASLQKLFNMFSTIALMTLWKMNQANLKNGIAKYIYIASLVLLLYEFKTAFATGF
jgi:hypothetical protein